MRQSVRRTPKRCLAICVAMTLRLSPWVTATKASACLRPTRASTSWSIALPACLRPLKSVGRRLNASGRISITVTSCPSLSSQVARVAPTRPQPMMTTFIGYLFPDRLSENDDLAWRVGEDILWGRANLEFAENALVADAHSDGVNLAVGCLVNDRVTFVAGLQQLAGDLVVHPVRYLFRVGHDVCTRPRFAGHFSVQGQVARYFDHVNGVDGALISLREVAGQSKSVEPRS